MNNHLDGTICWYVDWLKERNPEWTEERCLELATGFATAQQPLARPTLDELTEENEKTNAEERKAERAGERKDRQYLTGKELMAILTSPN